MKHFTLIILTFFLFPIIANSQPKNSGAKVGINFSNFSDPNFFIKNGEYLLGFNAYLFYDYFQVENFILGAEAGFNRKGWRIKVRTTGETGNEFGEAFINQKTNYVTVSNPIKFGIELDGIKPYLIIAPRVDFYTGYSVSTDGFSREVDSAIVNTPDELLENLSKTVFGINGGIGLELRRLLPKTLMLETRYQLDLTNSYESNLRSLRNKSIEILVGIKF